MSIVTKTGDHGETEFKGKLVSKTDINIEFLGTIDELISVLSVANSFVENQRFNEEIAICQEALINLNTQFAGGEYEDMSRFTQYFEESIKINESQHFLFSITSHIASSFLDNARCVARRAERIFYMTENDRQDFKEFLNRLSDFLFVLSRLLDAEGM